MRNKKLVNYSKYGYLFSIPFILTFLIFTMYPIIYTLIIGYTDLQGNGKTDWHTITTVIQPKTADAQEAFEEKAISEFKKNREKDYKNETKGLDSKNPDDAAKLKEMRAEFDSLLKEQTKQVQFEKESESIASDKLEGEWRFKATFDKNGDGQIVEKEDFIYESSVSWVYLADPTKYAFKELDKYRAEYLASGDEDEEEEDVEADADAEADAEAEEEEEAGVSSEDYDFARLVSVSLHKKSNFFVRYEYNGTVKPGDDTSDKDVMTVKLSTGEEVTVYVQKIKLFENFTWVLTNPKFQQSFKNTVIIWIINFIPQLGFALLFTAWFTDRRSKVKGSGLFKILFYMPNIITAATLAILFNVLFGFPKGAVNDLLVGTGVMKEAYRFNDHEWALKIIVAFVQFYQWYGYTMVNLIAGVIGISPEIFEAAEIDGANRAQTFFRVTIPCIRQILLFVLVTSLIGGLNMFDVPELYAGVKQANGAVMTLNMFVRMVGLSGRYLYNKAAAASVIMFVIIVALSAVVFYILRDKDEAKLKKLRKQELKALKAM